jgi:hypothetical protein
MSSTLKVIVSAKGNLEVKYGKDYSSVIKLIDKLIEADKARNFDTRLFLIDDVSSASALGLKPVAAINRKNCKKAIDDLFKKLQPAYIVILGAPDVFPFQELINQAEDPDTVVPSDLPYACGTAYSRNISSFTGPTRVVGRIPDIPGSGDIKNFAVLIDNIIKYKPVQHDKLLNYFAVTAKEWERSTQQNMLQIFGNAAKLLNSPPVEGKYTKTQFKPLVHFHNCHGAMNTPCYFGQDGQHYPKALSAADLNKKISYGTVVAAECCYGAQLFSSDESDDDCPGISSTYLLNNALAFLGSSTVAYGPCDSLANADLICQYFIKNIINSASTGRALLEARQKFLTVSGPQLDPYELKTLAQFFLLGDPSLQIVADDERDVTPSKSMSNSVENRRISLLHKGLTLQKSIVSSQKMTKEQHPEMSDELKSLVCKKDFYESPSQSVYAIKPKGTDEFSKSISKRNMRYRTFVKEHQTENVHQIHVLVVKEDDDKVLGWREYVSR